MLTVDASQPSKPTIKPTPVGLPEGQQLSGTWEVIKSGTTMGDAPLVDAGWTLEPIMQQGIKKGYKVIK